MEGFGLKEEKTPPESFQYSYFTLPHILSRNTWHLQRIFIIVNLPKCLPWTTVWRWWWWFKRTWKQGRDRLKQGGSDSPSTFSWFGSFRDSSQKNNQTNKQSCVTRTGTMTGTELKRKGNGPEESLNEDQEGRDQMRVSFLIEGHDYNSHFLTVYLKNFLSFCFLRWRFVVLIHLFFVKRSNHPRSD